MKGEPLLYASLVAERAHGLAKNGLGHPFDEQEVGLRDLTAASANMRIDALGVALRKI
jgi:hypothetical protein